MRTNVQGVELLTDGDKVVLAHNREGAFEPETFNELQKIIKSYNRPVTFVDVGAYTGIYSIFAAKLGCDVQSFEPNPRVYTRFVVNVNYNYAEMGGWSGVIHYHRCALSDDVGASYFNVDPSVKITSGGSLESTVLRNKENYLVEINTYDNDFCIPDIIKIDVEGHELSVLRGMQKSLSNYRPIIIIEANTQIENDNTTEFLVANGYKLYGKYDKRNLIFKHK
jgi:FkbM family methyltransferase